MIAEPTRAAVLRTAQALLARGLTIGDSGNVSARLTGPEGQLLVAITPHGRYYDELAVEDIPVVDAEGDPVDGDALPSVELMLHAGVYQARPDVSAIIHAHPTWSSAIAALELPIPPILEDQVIYLGGEIHVASCASTGSEELIGYAIQALGDRNACILARHGVLTVGRSPRAALHHCQYLEKTALAFLCATWAGQVATLPPGILATAEAFFRARP
jgi:L-fuculose-phosphate aldolase